MTASLGAGAVPGVTNGVKADGSNVVIIQVDGATAPIKVTTSRGLFTNGMRTLDIAATTGTAELVVCDARTDSGCAGPVIVSASDGGSGVGAITLSFVGYERICNDDDDDNGDGRTDCADPDCDQLACVDNGGNAGTCGSLGCVLPICTPTGSSEVCDNHVDDDCGGQIDCQQSSCDNQPCKTGSATFVCKTGVCTDLGSGFGLDIVPARTRLPADGVATTTITVTVTNQADPSVGTQVDFTTDLGAFIVGANAVTTTSVNTGTDGIATITFRASDTSGTATVNASLHSVPQVEQTAFITMPALGSINVATLQHQVMGVKFSGFNEQNQISVLLLDTEQRPYPDGLAVRFEHQQLGRTAISTPYTADTATCIQANGCLGYLGQTSSPPGMPDTDGTASLNLYSGTASGPVSISVSATAGQATRTFTVQNIAIVGAKASGAQISLFCTRQNVPALLAQDCTNSFYGGPGAVISCTVSLADRFNNLLGVATRADFRSEAGSAGPPVLTLAYDPVAGGDQSAVIGRATNSVLVTGFKLPADVPPLSNEFRLTYPTSCGTLEHNPRDGLGTVMVAVQGEEGFVDLNGNGQHDSVEPFVDAGEPFVDENDNGIQDNNERFIDVNQNGSWDGPNGTWDADTVVWAETRVLYTGASSNGRWAGGDAANFPNPTAPVSFHVSHGPPPTTQRFAVIFSDENFNPTTPAGTYLVSSLNGNASAMFVSAPATVDNLGMTFVQQYCDQKPEDNPTSCFATCQTAPCYRVARVTSFGYAAVGIVDITGAAAGPGTVRGSVDINGVVSQHFISGIID